MKSEKCKEHKHECGKFKGGESKEEKLKHLKQCKQELLSKIDEIDKAIAELE
jgi:hypothetical protein